LKRGDVYFASLDPSFGHEQQGTRPVLIVSSDEFNQMTSLPIIVPITTGGGFARAIGMSVSLMGLGTKTTGIVRCDQPRVVDLSARNARRVESLPEAVVEEVLAKVASLFE
jgi:mRNA-degrading endonuclease toxin of MazEF toxin-antitoxin module